MLGTTRPLPSTPSSRSSHSLRSLLWLPIASKSSPNFPGVKTFTADACLKSFLITLSHSVSTTQEAITNTGVIQLRSWGERKGGTYDMGFVGRKERKAANGKRYRSGGRRWGKLHLLAWCSSPLFPILCPSNPRSPSSLL